MIDLADNYLLYTDASNTLHKLRKDGDVYKSAIGTQHIQARLSRNHIELKSDGLVKTFESMGNQFNIVSVRDQFGNKLDMRYRDGLLESIRSAHGRSIEIGRDSMGRVSTAADDVGRTVAYTYDEAGNLIDVDSSGQGKWQLGYGDRNYLSRITDPRGIVVLESGFNQDGKVAKIRLLSSTSKFQYLPYRTEITDGLDRKATFWQAKSGLTQSIRDVAGSFTHIEFDHQERPTSFSVNGDKRLTLAYGNGGKISSSSRKEGTNWIQQTLQYDGNGNILTIHQNDELVANYAYSKDGLVEIAVDQAGSRAYSYSDDGRLTSAGLGGEQLALKTNKLGELEGIRNTFGNTLKLLYNDMDRIEALELQRPDMEYKVAYVYDQNGLRSSGKYSVENMGENSIRFSYDQVGNLVTLNQPLSKEKRLEYKFHIGPANELLKIETSQDINYNMSYNHIGQLTHVSAGQREAVYEYDYDGNVNAVRVDERHVSWENEIPTSSLYSLSTKARVSGVFGSIDEIVYTRTRGTPFGPIVFSPNRLGFVTSKNEALPPDVLIQTSLRNRLISDSEGIIDPNPLSFDKPSSMLFIPPEYASVNCSFCIAFVTLLSNDTSFTVNGQSSAAVATNESVNFQLSDPTTACILQGINIFGPDPVPKPWSHSMSFGDGQGASALGTFNQNFSHAYGSNGTYVGRNTATCTCSAPNSSVFSFVSAAASVCVYGAQPTPPTLSAPAPIFLQTIPGAWGDTSINFFTSNLQCSATCGGAPYRITGNVSLAGGSTVRVTTHIPAVEFCSITLRSQTRKNATIGHENIHANAFVGTYNTSKVLLVGDFPSTTSCNDGIGDFLEVLNAGHALQQTRQNAHLDHIGEEIYFAVCPSQGTTMLELPSGIFY